MRAHDGRHTIGLPRRPLSHRRLTVRSYAGRQRVILAGGRWADELVVPQVFECKDACPERLRAIHTSRRPLQDGRKAGKLIAGLGAARGSLVQTTKTL